MMRNLRFDKKGFTLVELLVVVAIIAILVAIALPSFFSYKKRVYNAAAKSDLRHFKAAMEWYYADKFEYPNL
jgi:prepilin-type N-terminal cleavage/methylation domain-containing protein